MRASELEPSATIPRVIEPSTADIVIVNWNSGHWLRRCVESIAANRGGVGSVTIVDNGSADDSDVLEAGDLPLSVIHTGENLGFGRACNLGVRNGSASYILFLNPDAALLPGTLDAAIAFMDQADHGQVGVCGIKLLEEDGAVQRHCARLPTWKTFAAASSGLAALLPSLVPTLHDSGFDHLTSRRVDHVIGAFYLIRRDLFEALGGFDETFFVYLEDLDLSARVRDAGYHVFYLAEATGLHRGGGTSDQIKPQRLAYALESRIVYAFKHFAAPAAWTVAVTTLLVEPLPRLVRAAARGSGVEMRDTLSGYALLWRGLASRMTGRSGRAPAVRRTRSARHQL